jgi:hypothetical protein
MASIRAQRAARWLDVTAPEILQPVVMAMG